jgi:PDZ domain
MTPPRHLWSGDWRRESAAAADELAARRAEAQTERLPRTPEPETRPTIPATPPTIPATQAIPPTAPTTPKTAPTTQKTAPRPAPPRRPRRPARGLSARPLALGAVLAVLIAAAAYATLDSSSGPSSAAVGTPWLGLRVASIPIPGGALVQSVSRGGPAERAGLQPGDVITQIGEQTVTTPGDVQSLIAGRRPGDQVEIGIERGALTYTTDATLMARPSGSR